jgi:hypothetical protein
MELSREDFKTVLIGEGGWGPTDRKLARQNPGLTECRECSTPTHIVFHNARGIQRHVTRTELMRRIEQETYVGVEI